MFVPERTTEMGGGGALGSRQAFKRSSDSSPGPPWPRPAAPQGWDGLGLKAPRKKISGPQRTVAAKHAEGFPEPPLRSSARNLHHFHLKPGQNISFQSPGCQYLRLQVEHPVVSRLRPFALLLQQGLVNRPAPLPFDSPRCPA